MKCHQPECHRLYMYVPFNSHLILKILTKTNLKKNLVLILKISYLISDFLRIYGPFWSHGFGFGFGSDISRLLLPSGKNSLVSQAGCQVTLSELYHCHTHSTVQTYQAFCLQVAKIVWSAKLALKLLSLNLALPYSFRCTVISGLLPPSGQDSLVSQAGCQVTLSEPCTAILIPLYSHIRPSASKWPRFFGQPSWLPSVLSLNLALLYPLRCTVISGLLPPSGKNCLVSQAGCQVTLSEPCTAIPIPLYRHIRPSASKWPRFFGQPSWLPSYSLWTVTLPYPFHCTDISGLLPPRIARVVGSNPTWVICLFCSQDSRKYWVHIANTNRCMGKN